LLTPTPNVDPTDEPKTSEAMASPRWDLDPEFLAAPVNSVIVPSLSTSRLFGYKTLEYTDAL
ncbi:hypothetical protein, partial [Vibrio diabolicus]|uniref:hypothetical protein n=1 Tax=Vibrio diabolicus TaxID=50719 RepID=UPI00211B5125|nr:hypothetical protein [Vibrio diabolicus]